MALPITYRAVENLNPSPIDGSGSWYCARWRSKQAKPFNLPAAYRIQRVYTSIATLKGYKSFGGIADASSVANAAFVQPDMTQSSAVGFYIDHAVYKARQALVGTLNEQALLATNFIERKQAAEMMANRLFQLANFADAVRRRDIRSAAWILRDKSNSSTRAKWTTSKDAASIWLEFHFGWEPLIQDVYNVVKLLSDPLPGGYRDTDSLDYPPGKVKFDVTNRTTSNKGTIWEENQTWNCMGSVKAKAGAEFYVSNPNLYLSNRLGLVNPAAILWEAIPFSFVVDWFSTTSAWINQYSDLVGVTVRNPWYSWRLQAKGTFDKDAPRIGWHVHVEKDVLNSRRILGIPEVKLRPLPAQRISIVRAATAISLLINFLPKNHTGSASKSNQNHVIEWGTAPRKRT